MKLHLFVQEINALFREFDADGNHRVSFHELVRGIQGPLPPRRADVVKAAFRKLDPMGTGTVSLEDLALCFNANEDPDVKSGEKTQRAVRVCVCRNLVNCEESAVVGKQTCGVCLFPPWLDRFCVTFWSHSKGLMATARSRSRSLKITTPVCPRWSIATRFFSWRFGTLGSWIARTPRWPVLAHPLALPQSPPSGKHNIGGALVLTFDMCAIRMFCDAVPQSA